MDAQELRQRFDELHNKGVENFGTDWLRANQQMVNAALTVGADPSKLEIKVLLSEACYRLLSWDKAGRP